MAERYLSPLRYPGGKAALGRFFGELIESSRPRRRLYAEPFAGGGGAALHLLVNEYVDSIWLSDLDRSLVAFWRSMLYRSDELIGLVMATPVTIDEWHRQHSLFVHGSEDELSLGFAAFYMNRTNRSGILRGRPIGGLGQKGPWPIDARFNRCDLAERIATVARYRSRIHVSWMDARDFLRHHQRDLDEAFIYLDPPYLTKSERLYLDTMEWKDHVEVAGIVRKLQAPWIVSYDADKRVHQQLYPGERCASFGIKHTAAGHHIGREYIVFSDAVSVERMATVGSGTSRWLRR